MKNKSAEKIKLPSIDELLGVVNYHQMKWLFQYCQLITVFVELLSRRDGNLEKNELYNQYQKYISELVSFVSMEGNTQNAISQKERNLVAEIENEYMQTISELQRAKQTISNQYRSIWESCTTNAGLRRPEAQRSSYTDTNWRECVRVQEQAAKEIQEWFTRKTQQAFVEKQRKLQQEAERKAASALSAAEAERKRKEEEAAMEAARGASLLEEMKRKYRKNI